MFLDPDMRSVPPRWDPPRRKPEEAKRQENAAVAIVLLVAISALFAPFAGGTLVAMVAALLRQW